MNLSGKVALVTGASRGIGRAIALRFAQAGATVVINYHSNDDMADQLLQEIKGLGKAQASLNKFNIGNSAEVDAAIKDICVQHQRLDILVNNAGVAKDNLLMRAKDEEINFVIQTNLVGALYCSRAVLRPMIKNRYGRIVNISSMVAEMGNAGQTVYAAAKAGLLGFTKSLAREVSKKGITVNAITPGYIESDMTRAMSDSAKEAIISAIPVDRVGSGEDVAELALFLGSQGSGYITGQTLAVNGGMYM